MSDHSITDAVDGFDVPAFFLYGVGTAFVVVFVLFHLTKDVLIPRFATASFRERLASQKRKDLNFFYASTASMLHSLAHSCFHPMHISLGYSPEHSENRVTHFDDGWPAYFSGIFVGYLVADFIVLGPINLGPAFVVHHLAAIAIWTWSTCSGAMQWYGSFCQFCEFSTIFYNIRQWALTSGYSSGSPVVTAVSLLFFLSFFAVRVAPMPKLVHRWTTTDYAKLADEKGTALAVANSSTLIIHVLLQSFWFFLMVKKIVKMVVSPGNGKEKGKEA